MKKFFIILAMVLMAVFCLRAGTLGDVFDNKVRPAATMLQEMPADQLAEEGFSNGVVAIGTPDVFGASSEALTGMQPAVEVSEGNQMLKLYTVENGDNSEMIVLISDGIQCVVTFMRGTAEAVKNAAKK